MGTGPHKRHGDATTWLLRAAINCLACLDFITKCQGQCKVVFRIVPGREPDTNEEKAAKAKIGVFSCSIDIVPTKTRAARS